MFLFLYRESFVHFSSRTFIIPKSVQMMIHDLLILLFVIFNKYGYHYLPKSIQIMILVSSPPVSNV